MINTPLRKSIAVRTFGDWIDPPPGFFEMDMVKKRCQEKKLLRELEAAKSFGIQPRAAVQLPRGV
jgi:hypothetical protein